MSENHLDTLSNKLTALQQQITAIQAKPNKAAERRLRKATVDLGRYLVDFRKQSVAATGGESE